jgi:hemin uptake protein HemP
MTDSNTGQPREAERETGQSRRRIDMVADRLDSRDLFVGTREIIIVHGDDSYRLRLTAQNKLILTK